MKTRIHGHKDENTNDYHIKLGLTVKYKRSAYLTVPITLNPFLAGNEEAKHPLVENKKMVERIT